MAMQVVDAARFWDLYFRNAFLRLARGDGKYAGEIRADEGGASTIADFMRDVEPEGVEISFTALRAHDYAADGRFALVEKRPIDTDRAYTAVARLGYPYREPAPFGKQRMAELFAEIRTLWLSAAPVVALADVERAVAQMVDRYVESYSQPLAALAWFLGEQRTRSSAEALMGIVRNARFNPFARTPIASTAVSAAFSALWKVNDKRTLWALLELMPDVSDTGRRTMAPLFERLLSTTELLGAARLGDDYLRPEFWRSLLAPHSAWQTTEWDRYDAGSIFWELRHLAATRLPTDDAKYLGALSDDEVRTVGDAARARFVYRTS